ncbi:hypothetical protein QNZ79_004457 [Vibrio parahaemolyticus]|nr:hypothetical protein [Vibrio parahaemolyticus]
MDNFEQYQNIMADWAAETLGAHKDSIVAGETVEFENQDFFYMVFRGFTEITDTFEALEFSATLLSVASPRSKKVAKEKYIRFVVNTYLQDVYILKERLNAYATKIKRAHERMGRSELVEAHIEPLFESVKTRLQGLVNARGGHVHQERFRDELLSEASSLELLVQFDDKFEFYYERTVTQVKRDWHERIVSNNEATKAILNDYFGGMLRVVAENDRVITP